MADVKVSEELAKKFATEKDRDTPYQRWVRAEGLEIIGGHYVPNLRTVELNPWPRRGGRGVRFERAASDAHLDLRLRGDRDEAGFHPGRSQVSGRSSPGVAVRISPSRFSH